MNGQSRDAFYDLLIVGGGMVGASLACALADLPLRVAVIEAREPVLDWPLGSHDLRVSAVTRASERILQNIGAWQKMGDRCSYGDMHVWDGSGDGVIHFDSGDIGEPNLGHIIENRVMQKALYERIQELDNVDYLCPVTLKNLAWDNEFAYLESDDGRLFTAKLVVGADGGNSWVRQQAQIKSSGWDYDQHAVVATVRTSEPHQHTAWQRFMPDGPLAFLPLSDGQSSIVWSTTPEDAERLVALSDDSFMAELQVAFGTTLGRIEAVGQRGAFPLRLRHANAYVRPKIALIGDAAHTIHPLAGQGVNLGFLDAAVLAQVLGEAIVNHRNIGSITTLRRYERWRKGENMSMLAAMDGFKRLFGNEIAPVRWVRNLGLNLTHSVLPVKNVLIRHAMGLAGDLPRLARD